MKFNEILETDIVSPGEYIYYPALQTIGLCGAFNRNDNFIRALCNGRLIEDKINKFKKIQLTVEEHKKRKTSRCKGCS